MKIKDMWRCVVGANGSCNRFQQIAGALRTSFVIVCICMVATFAKAQAVKLTDLSVEANRESGKIAPSEEKAPFLFINHTAKGAALQIADKTYPSGMEAIHGSLSWSFDLGSRYSSLVMDILQEGTASLKVFGDGKPIYDSGSLLPRIRATPVIDVRGVKELQFAVIDNGVGFWNDRIVIGNPVLLKRALPEVADVPGKNGTPAPVAKITAVPASGVAALEVKFTGDESKAPAGQVGRYTWTFGDGATETLSPNPSHTFADPGVYEVVLQAEDNKGGVGISRQIITVLPSEHQPPIAVIKAPARLVQKGEAVRFDGADSASTDSKLVSYQWNFGDGQRADGKTLTHEYAEGGRYSATLTVQDEHGKEAKAAVSIKVKGSEETPVFPLQKGARVLLIGNSLIGFCGPVDGWLTAFDKLSPQPLGLVCQARGKGLGKLVEYATWARLAVHEKIEEGWDVVIIQPWEDAFDPRVSDEQLLHDCKTLVDWARQAGAFPVLYEPQFGWQNLDADQARAHARISAMAEKLDTGFVPGGQAWLVVAKDLPMKKPGFQRSVKETDPATLDGLMYSDFGHQSFTGALFNSLMMWRYLTGESLSELKLSPTEKDVPDQAKRAVVWERLPFLEKIAEQMIVPASQRMR